MRWNLLLYIETALIKHYWVLYLHNEDSLLCLFMINNGKPSASIITWVVARSINMPKMFHQIIPNYHLGPLLLTWLSNYIHDEVCNEIIHPFPKLNGCTVEWISNVMLVNLPPGIHYPRGVYMERKVSCYYNMVDFLQNKHKWSMRRGLPLAGVVGSVIGWTK